MTGLRPRGRRFKPCVEAIEVVPRVKRLARSPVKHVAALGVVGCQGSAVAGAVFALP